MNSAGLFYRKKPLFGFDIGNGSIKVIQLEHSNKKTSLAGYGKIDFNSKAIKDGEIIDFAAITKAAQDLMDKRLTGSINSRRVAASLPVLHSFNRIINLPRMNEKDIFEAVKLEAEQYIPVPINDLYIDYQLVEENPESQDFLVAAAPKRVVDSFTMLFDKLGLELVCMEPTILSVMRIVQNAEDSDLPTLVIDCGSITTDLIIFNKSAVRVTGTIQFGGETITKSIMDKLNVSYAEAFNLKSSYGIDPGKNQERVMKALKTNLEFLVTEIKKIIRFFEERNNSQGIKVEQIIVLGGGANLPGLSTYLTSELRIPSRLISIWEHISLNNIEKPNRLDNSMYATAAGLALIKPEDAAR